jgi:hypothetical protein
MPGKYSTIFILGVDVLLVVRLCIVCLIGSYRELYSSLSKCSCLSKPIILQCRLMTSKEEKKNEAMLVYAGLAAARTGELLA